MPFIDMETYRHACEKARELVDPVTLREAIYGVYALWIADKDAGNRIVFHEYFGISLLELGIDTLYEAEQYRKALGAYFNPRAVKKLKELRERKREMQVNVPQNNVEFANSMSVRIRVNESVSLVFRATLRSGPLKWVHVDEAFKVIHAGDGVIEDADRHHAKKQALQVLRSVRRGAAKNAHKK